MRHIYFILLLTLGFNTAFAETKASACSTVASGRSPASAPACDTAGELMSLETTTKDFKRICKDIVSSDPACKKIKPEKRMNCLAKGENEIFSSNKMGAKIFSCLKGFIWDSMVELGEFVVDLIKMYVKFQVNSYTAMYNFLTDSEYREKAIAASGKALTKGGKLGAAFLNSSAQYFAREYSKNLALNPLDPMAALGKTLLEPLMKFMTEAVQSIIAEYVPQYQCMNGPAKLNTICKMAGDFVMPPAFMIGWMKYGAKGLMTMSKSAKVSKFKNLFASANEVQDAVVVSSKIIRPGKEVAEGAAQKLVVTSVPESASTSLKGAAVRSAKAQRRIGGKIEKATDSELTDIARVEKAKSTPHRPAPVVEQAVKLESVKVKAAKYFKMSDEELGLLIETFGKQGITTETQFLEKLESLGKLKKNYPSLFEPNSLISDSFQGESEALKLVVIDDFLKKGIPKRNPDGTLKYVDGVLDRTDISVLPNAKKVELLEKEFKGLSDSKLCVQ